MKNKSKNKKASAVIEYITLIVFVLSAFLVFEKYVLNAFSGKWRSLSDVFGHGRQYDPRDFGSFGEEGGTLECFYDSTHCRAPSGSPAGVYVPNCGNGALNLWIGTRCFEKHCDCTIPPESSDYDAFCLECLIHCSEEGDDQATYPYQENGAAVEFFCAD